MRNNIDIEIVQNELPSRFADRLGICHTKSVKQEHKKSNGQFFTPVEIADLMGSFIHVHSEQLRILDPGCGTAILSCALIENIIVRNKHIRSIELHVYETDLSLIIYLTKSLDYLEEWLHQQNVDLVYNIHTTDFVLNYAHRLTNKIDLFQNNLQTFDIVISNPPYFKLSSEDKRSLAANEAVHGHPNIYSLFMAISAKLLNDDGQLVFITPRSFASGSYFKLFREYFFKLIELDFVHLFVSRKDTFSRDKVLQETVVLKGTRKNKPNPEHRVKIYSSNGLKDISVPVVKSFYHRELIDLTSNEKILYLPTNDQEERILNTFKNWSGHLNKYNIQISTGPVVAFRSWDSIQDSADNSHEITVPLFWLHNVKPMELEWPIIKPAKGQYLKVNEESKSSLIPNKNYILIRRFSSKDDKSRLVAAPYFCNFIESDLIGVENKVNYVYRPKGNLDRNEIVGLCALFNSTLFDSFFRIYNGNVNVSATELRDMPLPPLETIKEIGDQIILANDYSIDMVNRLVSEQLELAQTAV